MRKTFAVLGLATMMTLAGGSAAFAADPYTPGTPTTPGLGGSSVEAGCTSGSPVITTSIVLTDPSDEVTSRDASLVLSGSGGSTTIALGTVGADGTLTSTSPWPAASWARSSITASVTVGDLALDVPLSYSATCGAAGAAATGGLAATGMEGTLLPLGIAGGVLTAVGVGIVLRRRSTRA